MVSSSVGQRRNTKVGRGSVTRWVSWALVENSPIISPAEAADRIREGAVVALPTETVYGLAARITDEAALRSVFMLKGRPADNPLIVHVMSAEQADTVGIMTDMDRTLAEAFWPGPLTLVVQRRPVVPDLVTAGLPTVAVREPDSDAFREVLMLAGEPLAAPSANLSGRPSPTRAEHVVQDHQGRVPVVDGGPCRAGLESTVIQVEENRILILRPGVITRADLERVSGLPVETAADDQRSASPGTRYRHYAPQARVRVFTDLETLKDAAERAVGRTLILSRFDPGMTTEWRPLQADQLYAELRAADELPVDEILVHCDDVTVRDEALMDRLLRAADTDSEAG